MANKDITSIRGTIDFLEEQNEILTIGNEVNPIYEIAFIKASQSEYARLVSEMGW